MTSSTANGPERPAEGIETVRDLYLRPPQHGSSRCVILCSGPSAQEAHLELVTCPIIGVNHTFSRLPLAAFAAFVVVDDSGMRGYEPALRRMWEFYRTPVFLGKYTDGRPHTWGIPLKYAEGPVRFCRDLANEGCCIQGVAPSTIQVAVWLGFREIVFVGLDGKPRGPYRYFDNRDMHTNCDYSNQHRAMRTFKPDLDAMGVRVWNTCMDSIVDVWEKKRLRELFPAVGM